VPGLELHPQFGVQEEDGELELTLPADRRPELTDQEFRVLHCMADGMSNAEISRELSVSEDTTKMQVRRLFRKLGARDRAHAVATAFRMNLVS
jgi:DNA-binding NarL/FixJ family response regulator